MINKRAYVKDTVEYPERDRGKRRLLLGGYLYNSILNIN